MSKKEKKFDCVEMKRMAAEKIWRKLNKMTRKQRLMYWKRGTEEIIKLQNELRRNENDRCRDLEKRVV